jgi:hypothetical protein
LPEALFRELFWPEDFGEVVKIFMRPKALCGPRVIIEKALKSRGGMENGPEDSESCMVTPDRQNGVEEPVPKLRPALGVHHELVILKVVAHDEGRALLTPDGAPEVGFGAEGHDAEFSALDSGHELGFHISNDLCVKRRHHLGVIMEGVLNQFKVGNRHSLCGREDNSKVIVPEEEIGKEVSVIPGGRFSMAPRCCHSNPSSFTTLQLPESAME